MTSPPPRTERLTSFGTNAVFIPYTDWMPATGLDAINAGILVTGMSSIGGSTVATLAVQTAATRTDVPDAWVAVSGGPSITGTGTAAANALSVTSHTSGKTWVRWGISFVGASGGSSADVQLVFATVSKGQPLGTWRGTLTATTATDSAVAVTGWIPAAWAQQVYAAILTMGAAGTAFKARLVFRTAVVSTDAPSAWNTSTDDPYPGTGGTLDRVASLTTYTPGAVMWVQFGLYYTSTSGTSVADVAVAVFGRRT